jgi:hypothetical protein
MATQLPPTPEKFEDSFGWYARARCGDSTDARAFTAKLESNAAQGDYVDPYAIARVYAALGDTTKALSWLDHAVTAGVWELWGIRSDPAFASLSKDARYQALVERARPH